jgi:arylsulfatase A-like enzyme
VLVDTLRADYGGAEPEFFRRFAASSVTFERAATTYPATFRAVASLVQGVHFRHAGPGRANLFSLWVEAGGEVSLFHDVRRGDTADVRRGAFADELWTSTFVDMLRRDKAAHTATIVDEVLARASARPDDAPPHLSWIHLDDPHHPWLRGPAGGEALELYRAEVAHVAAQLERLAVGLDATKRGRSAIVVIVGDHGEEFGEHGATMHGGHLYEESLRVPMMLRLPGRPPRRIGDDASTLDLLPTLLHALALPRPAGLEGRDFFDPTASAGGPRVVAQLERGNEGWSGSSRPNQVVVRDGALKLIVDLDAGVYRLFDLGADPGERRALGSDRAAQAQRLLDALAIWQDRRDCRSRLPLAASRRRGGLRRSLSRSAAAAAAARRGTRRSRG